MVRIILGQGRLMTRMPPAPWGMSWPVSSTTAAAMPGSGSVQLPGTSGGAPGGGAGEGGDHMAAGFGLPEGVDDGAALAAHVLVVPHPGFGVDRLADAA